MYLETETLLLLTGVWACMLVAIFALRRRRSTLGKNVMNQLGEIKGMFSKEEKEVHADTPSDGGQI
jgi:hypothetical protein